MTQEGAIVAPRPSGIVCRIAFVAEHLSRLYRFLYVISVVLPNNQPPNVRAVLGGSER